jgi:hypothetical protein
MHACNYFIKIQLHSTSHPKNTKRWFKPLDKYFTQNIFMCFYIYIYIYIYLYTNNGFY